MKASNFTRKKANILVPIDHNVKIGSLEEERLCRAYECIEERYIELPFLDPNKDISRINNFFNGKFMQFDVLFLIFVCAYLLSKFNDITVSISKFLSNTSGNLTNLQGIGSSAYPNIEPIK